MGETGGWERQEGRGEGGWERQEGRGEGGWERREGRGEGGRVGEGKKLLKVF